RLLDRQTSLRLHDPLLDGGGNRLRVCRIRSCRECGVVQPLVRLGGGLPGRSLATGRRSGAVGRAEGIVAAGPLREHFWAQLMLALVRSGRRAEALRVYQSARRTGQAQPSSSPAKSTWRTFTALTTSPIRAPSTPPSQNVIAFSPS